MKTTTYWDHTEAERGALTEEQVRALEPLELMAAGLQLAAPELEALEPEEDAELKTETWFIVDAVPSHAFSSVEAARRVIAVLREEQATGTVTDYLDSYRVQIKRLKPDPETEFDLKEIQIPTESEVERRRESLTRVLTAKSRNEGRRSRHEEACRAHQKALKGMWDDWRERVREHAKYDAVRGVWRDYLRLCDGNGVLAMTFLRKAHSEDFLEAAAAWLDDAEMRVALSATLEGLDAEQQRAREAEASADAEGF